LVPAGFAAALSSRVDFIGGRGDFAFAFAPEPGDLLEQLQKAWPAVARVRRKIGAAEKRLQIRREKDIHRPAAAAGRGLHERHVNFVHVRAFLAVHLDADEMFVEKFAPMFSSSNDSRSMTWHQWQVE
jgi:hypothetical protein